MSENNTQQKKQQQKKQQQKRPMLSFEQRVERKLDLAKKLIEQNPRTTHIITLELDESYELFTLIEEIEVGLRDLKLSMYTPKNDDEAGAAAIKRLNHSKKLLTCSVEQMNVLGFGKHYTVKDMRDKQQKQKNLTKNLINASPELKEVIEKHESFLNDNSDKKAKLIEKFMEADKVLDEELSNNVDAYQKQIKDAQVKIAEENRVKKEAAQKLKTEKAQKMQIYSETARTLKTSLKEAKARTHEKHLEVGAINRDIKAHDKLLIKAKTALETAKTALETAKTSNVDEDISTAQQTFDTSNQAVSEIVEAMKLAKTKALKLTKEHEALAKDEAKVSEELQKHKDTLETTR